MRAYIALLQKLLEPQGESLAAQQLEKLDRTVDDLEEIVQGYVAVVNPEKYQWEEVAVAPLFGAVREAIAPELAQGQVTL